MTDKPKPKLVTVVAVVLVIGYIAITALGKRLDSNQLLGCLLVGTFMFGISLLAFLVGALPFRALGASDKTIQRAFIFACLCLVYAVLQIPLWCRMTHQFPPGKMGDTQSGFAAFGVVLSLFGPAAPLIVRFGRYFRARSKEQREVLRRKKAEHDEPGA
jgi:hypothetical protein